MRMTLRTMTLRFQKMIGSLAALGCFLALGAVPAGADDAMAYQALMHGHLEEASTLLHRQLAANGSDARAHQLLCRTAYAEDQPDAAIGECLQATRLAPSDAKHQMWLGRAYGLKASDTLNFMAALKLASRVREAFERAVQLDPNDVEAVSELAEFYISAPSLAGGNTDRAGQLANGMMPRHPARAHRLLGLLARKNGDDQKAEAEFKAAIAAGNGPEAWIDLALFYEHKNQKDQVLACVQKALALDVQRGPVEVDAASILTTAKRSPEIAEAALRAYLASSAQTDEAPVPRVHVQLGKLLAKRGDTAGARNEYNAALQLAPHFEPAQKALDTL